MDYLIASLTVIGTFIAGIFGNIVAHDFCQFAPRICKRLIERAARTLPDNADQERYLEEWLAHLGDCRGVLEQYRHAITCVLGARRLRTDAAKRIPRFKRARFEFSGIGVVDLDFGTGMTVMHFIIAITSRFAKRYSQGHLPQARIAYIWFFVSTFCISAFKCRRYGRMNRQQISALLKLVMKAIKQNNGNIVVDVDGKRLDVAKHLHAKADSN